MLTHVLRCLFVRLTLKHAGHRAEQWSGEATRGAGLAVEETRVDVTIGDDGGAPDAAARKERPVWMVESTIVGNDQVAPHRLSLVITYYYIII